MSRYRFARASLAVIVFISCSFEEALRVRYSVRLSSGYASDTRGPTFKVKDATRLYRAASPAPQGWASFACHKGTFKHLRPCCTTKLNHLLNWHTHFVWQEVSDPRHTRLTVWSREDLKICIVM